MIGMWRSASFVPAYQSIFFARFDGFIRRLTLRSLMDEDLMNLHIVSGWLIEIYGCHNVERDIFRRQLARHWIGNTMLYLQPRAWINFQSQKLSTHPKSITRKLPGKGQNAKCMHISLNSRRFSVLHGDAAGKMLRCYFLRTTAQIAIHIQ